MNFKLVIFVVVLVGIQSASASEFEAEFLGAQNDFISINNSLDDGEDVALKDLKELNFDAHKKVKLAGKEYRQSNCEGSENLCNSYRANLIKCVNVNYQKSPKPAFKCSVVNADNIDEDLEISNAMIGCNKPQNKLPGYIRTPCVLRYQFRFIEDNKDIKFKDIKKLNFDSSRTIELGERKTKQAECEGDKNLCRLVGVQLIKCQFNNSEPKCEIKSSSSRNDMIKIDSPKIGCKYSPVNTDYARPPCFIRYNLKVKN